MTTTTPTHGSLFSGAGLLDLAVEEVFGARTVWVSDIEPGPRKVLAHRFPGVPNLGDITAVDWTRVEPVDILAGGSPCQDISAAGRMAGMREGTRSNLWVEMREAIRVLQPKYVIWENVRGALSTPAASAMESDPRLLGDHPNGQPVLRALGRVLGDLADLGYDAIWHGLRAADVGAPHGRFRIFVIAANTERLARREWRLTAPGQAAGGRSLGADPRRDRAPVALLPTPKTTDDRAHSEGDMRRNDPGLRALPSLLPTPRATDGTKGGPNQRGSSGDLMLPSAVMQLLPTPRSTDKLRSRSAATERRGAEGRAYLSEIAVQLLPAPSVADATGGHERRGGNRGDELLLKGIASHQAWGPYAAAITRWEAIVGPAPAPTKPGRTGRPKLNPAFAEWMMGAPTGWITNTPGVTDTEALRMAGNGVVRQHAVAALRLMLNRMETPT